MGGHEGQAVVFEMDEQETRAFIAEMRYAVSLLSNHSVDEVYEQMKDKYPSKEEWGKGITAYWQACKVVKWLLQFDRRQRGLAVEGGGGSNADPRRSIPDQYCQSSCRTGRRLST